MLREQATDGLHGCEITAPARQHEPNYVADERGSADIPEFIDEYRRRSHAALPFASMRGVHCRPALLLRSVNDRDIDSQMGMTKDRPGFGASDSRSDDRWDTVVIAGSQRYVKAEIGER